MNHQAQFLMPIDALVHQRTFQPHGAPLLSPMLLPSFSQARFGAGAIPQSLTAKTQQHAYKMTLKAQAQLQTQQIDSAIQLLKMQYDAIMSSVEQSTRSTCSEVAARPSESQKSTAVDQGSFAVDFELPGPESVCGSFVPAASSLPALSTHVTSQKRKVQVEDQQECSAAPKKRKSAVQPAA
jgi:hypothetical protein